MRGDMNKEFSQLQGALRNEGFETVYQSVAQVYQLPATCVGWSAILMPFCIHGDPKSAERVFESHIFGRRQCYGEGVFNSVFE